MKTREFERILAEQGFILKRIASHRVWTNGTQHVAVPLGKQINRMIARRLLKEIGYKGVVPELNFG
jgi:predicted RNA binding protein YcfA (HicA-like mRNA interferase family)